MRDHRETRNLDTSDSTSFDCRLSALSPESSASRRGTSATPATGPYFVDYPHVFPPSLAYLDDATIIMISLSGAARVKSQTPLRQLGHKDKETQSISSGGGFSMSLGYNVGWNSAVQLIDHYPSTSLSRWPHLLLSAPTGPTALTAPTTPLFATLSRPHPPSQRDRKTHEQTRRQIKTTNKGHWQHTETYAHCQATFSPPRPAPPRRRAEPS